MKGSLLNWNVRNPKLSPRCKKLVQRLNYSKKKTIHQDIKLKSCWLCLNPQNRLQQAHRQLWRIIVNADARQSSPVSMRNYARNLISYQLKTLNNQSFQKKFEKERTGLKSTIEKQQVLLHKLQEEQAGRDEQNLLLLNEVQKLNSLNSGLMEIKKKFEQLQDECRKKDLDAARRNEKTTKKEETSKLEELTYRLGQEIEWKTKQLSEYQALLDTTTKRNEEYKQEIRKRSHRMRDLKKERDRLKIELLQLKQSLRNKVNQKDEIIQKLKEELHFLKERNGACLLYTSPSPRDLSTSRMPSSA
eukprot:TRINITY_DN60378_c0_g1_i1.p1 TRINITY_DN60378_c0_g1~~TRINITY_DN60378_c0_g1_i1.p1  ORF type:complete len:303 (-),score=39.46 TRINITY_DN60378_c0_g1_i1:36-944(-)